MIELKDVSKKYGNFVAAKNISFQVQAGEIIGLLGVNGAGKTTIMKMITGYHNPHSGEVLVCGNNVLENPVKSKEHIGYLPETNPLYDDLLVIEYLAFIADARSISIEDKKTAIDNVIVQCNLQEFVYKPISDLSKGMRQRVGLAQALVHNPDVLILDEPTSGLDPNQIKEIRSVIKSISNTKAIMLSTHILQEVEALCDRILIVHQGQIVAEGTEQEIASKLKGEQSIKIEVVGDVPASVISSLETLDGVSGVQIISNRVDSNIQLTDVLVKTHTTDFYGEAVYDWANTKKIRLRSLQSTSKNLESIFESLTSLGN